MLGVGFLTIDADVADFAAMGFDELFALHEHAAGPATGVIDAPFIRGQQGDQHAHHGSRGVENSPPRLPSALANLPRKYS